MYLEPTSELWEIQRRTGYICNDPLPGNRIVYYLEVVKPLEWSTLVRKVEPDKIPVGSLTWAYDYDPAGSVHPEDNKLSANIKPDCFRLIKTSNEVLAEQIKPDTVAKYRFKTKEEFITSGRWIHVEPGVRDGGYPQHWASDGVMNKYLGQLVSIEGHEAIAISKERNRMDEISFDGWSFKEWNFIGANIVSPTPIEAQGVYEVQASLRAIDAMILQSQPVRQDDWRAEVYNPSLSSTSQNTEPIQYMGQKETITDDDIVIEPTFNITI